MSTTTKNWVTVKRGERFKATKSSPESWGYNGTCVHQHATCQLCDTEIAWRYALQNRNSGQVLLVGSECIKWYYEAYMPNGLELAIERMKLARRKTKQEVILEKIKDFANNGNRWIVDYLFGPTRRGFKDVYMFCDTKNEQYKQVYVSKFRASLRRKGYLRPDEIEAFCTGYNRSQYGLALEETNRSVMKEAAA